MMCCRLSMGRCGAVRCGQRSSGPRAFYVSDVADVARRPLADSVWHYATCQNALLSGSVLGVAALAPVFCRRAPRPLLAALALSVALGPAASARFLPTKTHCFGIASPRLEPIAKPGYSSPAARESGVKSPEVDF